MRSIITIVFLAWALSVRGQLVESYDCQSYAEGKMFHFRVSREQLLKAPVWHLDQDFPPLSPRLAEKAAQTEFDKIVKNTSQWTVERITLVDMGDKIHWVYLVQFRRFAQRVEDAQSLRVVVLLDGTVIEPQITQEKSPPNPTPGRVKSLAQ